MTKKKTRHTTRQETPNEKRNRELNTQLDMVWAVGGAMDGEQFIVPDTLVSGTVSGTVPYLSDEQVRDIANAAWRYHAARRYEVGWVADIVDTLIVRGFDNQGSVGIWDGLVWSWIERVDDVWTCAVHTCDRDHVRDVTLA